MKGSLLSLSDLDEYEERVVFMKGTSRDMRRSYSLQLVFLRTKLEWHKAEIFCLNRGEMLFEAREATLMQVCYQAAARDLVHLGHNTQMKVKSVFVGGNWPIPLI